MTDKRYLSHEEIQSELFRILTDLVEFLDGNGLRYSLYAGTLLGAVRHKGFIPWDDDVDICMPRPDYERLYELAGNVPEPYRLISNRNSELPLQFMKFWNTRIRAQEPAFEGRLEEFLWVDVFPIDGVPDDERLRKRHIGQIRSLIVKRQLLYADPEKATTRTRGALKSLYQAITPASKARALDKKIHVLLNSYEYEQSRYVACYASGSKIPWKMDHVKFEAFQLAEFEGYPFKIMGSYHDYLSFAYRDYMTLPSEEDRVTHDLRVWRA